MHSQTDDELDDRDLDSRTPPERIGSDLTNLVYKVRYKDSAQQRLGASTGYFKPKTPKHLVSELPVAYDDALMGYTLASSQLSERLGLNIVAKERVAHHHIENQKMVGTVSSEVANAAPMRVDGRARDIDLRNPTTQKGLSDLQLFDALTGQMDRRGENILVGPDGAITGIDEEASFGYGAPYDEGSRELMEDPDLRPRPSTEPTKYLGLPSRVDEATAEKFLALTPDDLRAHLSVDGPNALKERDLDRAVARLGRIHKHLEELKAGKQLVSEWGDDTYRASMEEETATSKDGRPVPRSYLARHAGERQLEAPAELLSQAVGQPIDQNRRHPIPQKMHRFWSGGPMSKSAMNVLMESAVKAQGTGWESNLWYSKSVEDKMDQAELTSRDDQERRALQREALEGAGFRIRPIEDLAQDDPARFMGGLFGKRTERERGRLTKDDLETMADKVVASIASGGGKIGTGGTTKFDELKHFSDVARLLYLEREGGHHFDVDMGLGDMDLDRPYFHNDPNGNIPLLGSLTPVSGDEYVTSRLEKIGTRGQRDLSDRDTSTAAKEVAVQASEMAFTLNGMIASRPGTPNLKAAIEHVRTDAIGNSPAIPSGMTVMKTLVSGEGNGASASREAAEAEASRRRALTVPPYLLDLEHLTDESDKR